MRAPKQRIKSPSPALFKRSLDNAHRPPARTPPAAGLSFRRAVGNHTLEQLIQTKLTVNQPGDRFERQADRVADAVMRMPLDEVPAISQRRSGIQRRCAACSSGQGLCPECEAEEEVQRKALSADASGIQRQREEDEREEPLQAKETTGQTPTVTPGLHARIQALRSGGQPLPQSQRAFFEPRFGYDFGGVRVHTGPAAAQAARMVRARAFAIGSEIVFGAGEYSPETPVGARLLAHELTHVVQQGRAGAAPRPASQVFPGCRSGRQQVTSRSGATAPGTIMRVPTESGIQETPPRYAYSTHCGWIDWGHASGGVPARLIRDVRNASNALATSATSSGEFVGPRMESQALGTVLSGVTPIARLRRALTQDEVLSVALRIFMLQSLAFEQLQSLTQLIGRSSFSEEDLPSNLIGFYMGARGFDRPTIENLCDVWDEARSLGEYQGYSFESNSSFRPPRLPAKGSWPAALADIQPAEVGGPLLDTVEGVLESFGSFSRRGNIGHLVGYELIHSGRLRIEPVGGSTTVDISSTESSSQAAPHFELRPLPAQHNLEFRWAIFDDHDNSFAMWGDRGQVHQYGSQFNAYIGSGTRALLRDRDIRSATIRCRAIAGRGTLGAVNRLFQLPVTFTW